jgi:hypothetical protein
VGESVAGDRDGSWGGRSGVTVMSSRIAEAEKEASFSMLSPAFATPSPSAAVARIDE